MAARPTRPARPGWDAKELPPVRRGCDRLPDRIAKRTGEAGICLKRTGRPDADLVSAFDHVDLDWLDFDVVSLQPLDGTFDVGAQAFQFQADDPNLVRDAGLADVGGHGEFVPQLPDYRRGDEPGRIHQPEARFLRACVDFCRGEVLWFGLAG